MAAPREDGISSSSATSDFTLDLLAELHASHFRPAAWWRFLARSWTRSRTFAATHPTLVASWARISIVLATGQALALAAEAWSGKREAARRALPGVALLFGLQQVDVYVHLAMNNSVPEGEVWDGLGLPTALTLGRQAVAGQLWGHLMARRPAGRASCAVALAVATATDIADGALARRHQRVSRLGRYLDGTADLSVALGLACTLAQQKLVPRWLVTLAVARWSLPVLYGFASYFGAIRRVPMESTRVGKLAGAAHVLTLGAALLPADANARWTSTRRALYRISAALLIAVPIVRWRRLRWVRQ